MTKHSFQATAVTVRKVRSDKKDLLPVNDLDGNGLSLIDLFYAFATQGITDGGFDDKKNSLIVTPTEVTPAGRTVLMDHESGNYGSKGRIRKSTGATSYEFDSDEAPVVPRQSLLVVPVAGDYAICVDHRIGVSGLPRLFWLEFRRAVRKHHKLLVDISQAADGAAWEAFLDDAEKLIQVTYTNKPDDIADGAVVTEAVGVRKYSANRYPGAESLPTRLLLFLRGTKKERQQAADLVLVPEDFGEVSEVSVTVESGGIQRTVSVDAEQWPAFVYNFSGTGAPSPDTFISDAREAARKLLTEQLDCELPTDWRDSAWSPERLDARLTRGGPDDDVDPDGDSD